MSKEILSRRAFLAATTTSVVLSGCVTRRVNTARVIPRKVSPNHRINIVGIGVGGMGFNDIMGCSKENVVAVCDVDWKRCEEAFYKLPDAKRFRDYRHMLEKMDKEIDAVVVSTPDHTHAPAAYTAMMLGKHVRVQKPLTHTIAEARLLTETAKANRLITQMGNQGNSSDGVREVIEMLWSGVIGDVTEAHVWTNRPGWPQGMATPLPKQPVPETMDWDTWIGTAPFRDYNADYAPFKWRGWWDFGCGAIGDMACHNMNPAYRALRLGEAASFTVEAIRRDGMTDQSPPLKSSVKYEFPARAGMPSVDMHWHDGGITPPLPEGMENEKLGRDGQGTLFIGTKGVITCAYDGTDSRLLPLATMDDYTRPDASIARIPREDHTGDWLSAIRDGRIEASSHFAYSGPLTEIANFGNVALLAQEKLEYDVPSMKITNHKAANTLLTKQYRKGWDKIMPL
jgi:predicted dehydrogenase